MSQFRLKKTWDGYTVQKKFLCFWIVVWSDYDGNTIYGDYDQAKAQLEKYVRRAMKDKEDAEQRRNDNKMRKSHVPTYNYPPLPDQEP